MEKEEEDWERALEGVVKTLGAFGVVNVLEKCDFWIVEDYYGVPEVLVELVGEKAVTDAMRDALKRSSKIRRHTICTDRC